MDEAVKEGGGGRRVGAGERVLREEDVARVEAEQRGRVGLERGAGQPHHAERQRMVLLLLLRRRRRGRRLHAAGVGRRHRRRRGALGQRSGRGFGPELGSLSLCLRARGSRAELVVLIKRTAPIRSSSNWSVMIFFLHVLITEESDVLRKFRISMRFKSLE